MKLLIGVSTYKRLEKLQKCLESIFACQYPYYKIVIVADNNDVVTAKYLSKVYCNHLTCVVQEDQGFVVGAWNRVVQEYFNPVEFDGFIGLVDDIELYPNALEEIVKCHQKNFPDTDGVCGFKQECPGHPEYTFKWFGQTLMGQRFIERYKEGGYYICCPYYNWSHQDEEMFQFASSLNKFKNCESAVIKHYHPCFIKEEIDETHNILREGDNSIRKHDLELFHKRQRENKIWGKSFET